MGLKDKLKIGVLTYGYLPMIMILEDAITNENYELCHEIECALKELEAEFKIEYPRKVTEETIYDYQTKFWHLGLSGEHAVENLPHYKDKLIEFLQNKY